MIKTSLLSASVLLSLISCTAFDPDYQAYKAEKERMQQEQVTSVASRYPSDSYYNDSSLEEPTAYNINQYNTDSSVINPGYTGETSTYTVQKGDTLWKLSRQFQTTVAELQQLNNIVGSNIAIGQVLIVPGL